MHVCDGVRARVCALTGMDVMSTRERGRRLVWWFSIPFSSRPLPQGGGDIVGASAVPAPAPIHQLELAYDKRINQR